MKNELILNNSATDWERVDAMRDEDIDLSDSPELTPEMFAKAIVRRGLKARPKKVQFTLRVEEDVLAKLGLEEPPRLTTLVGLAWLALRITVAFRSCE